MNKDNRKPTKEEWSSLYQAAIDFKRAACWKWMYDDDIFGVVDPENGETAYCCLMGNGGEHFAIAGYLGPEGLSEILGMLSGEISSDESESMYLQKCLMCSFEDRSFLKASDLKQIKELELKFRGKKEWPLFRSYEPGFVPWFISAPQCRFLTHILRQALEVALRCRESKDILNHESPFTFLTRVYQKTDTGEEWVDKYIMAEPKKPDLVSFNIQNELMLKRLKAIHPNQNLILEVDTYYAPIPVKEDARPYFPKICVLLDHHEGFAISFEMIRNIKEDGYKCIEMLINFIKQNNLMPARLLVAKEETYYIYFEACKQLGLPLEMVEYLKNAEKFRNGLFNQMMNTYR